MGNKGWTDQTKRLDPGGPLSTVRRSKADTAAGGDPGACFFMTPQSVGAQYRDHGWHNLDRPSGNDGLAEVANLPRQPDGYAGGDADLSGTEYVPAAYPGGTVA